MGMDKRGSFLLERLWAGPGGLQYKGWSGELRRGSLCRGEPSQRLQLQEPFPHHYCIGKHLLSLQLVYGALITP